MSVELHDAPVPKRADEQRVVGHIYPPGLPLLGQRAYCGHVRREPWSGAFYADNPMPDDCVVCLEIIRELEGR